MRVSADTNGLAIFAADQPVLTYQLNPSTALAWRRNFIHPLITQDGACITEDAPADHAHHRGLFWAWRRVLIGGVRVDSWTGDGFTSELVQRKSEASATGANLTAHIDWISTRHEPALRFVREQTSVAVADMDDARTLEITVRLRALVPNVELAGSDDDKSYSGPTFRFTRPELVQVASEGRPLEPALGAVPTGAAVDFTWSPRPEGFPRRVRTTCLVDGKPWTRWVLRQGPGMQNCAFPGRTPVHVPADRDLVIELSARIER